MAGMIRCNLGYSLKNIPIPSRDTYLKSLIAQTESFIKRLRWRVYWYQRDPDEKKKFENDVQSYGLKSTNSPPTNPLLHNFESEMYKLIGNIKFKNVRNEFQEKMSSDLKSLKAGGKIIVEAYKTSNLYQVPTARYQKLMHQNVTKDYKIADHIG